MSRRKHHAPADLEGALAELGIDVHRSTDDEVTAYCPGHLERVGREERNPSWSVNRGTGLHNCYSCGFSGTFIDLVMYRLFPNDTFRAARWIRQFGLNLARAADLVSWADRESSRVVENGPTILVPETRLAMYADVPDWALEARNLSRESVDHYGIRWDSKSEAWIIPVRHPTGQLAGWQKKWQKKRRFINDPKDMVKSECLFGYDVFPVGEPAVMMESPLDVPRLFTAGFEGGVATFGAAWSRSQLQLIAGVTDELICALDDDPDGRLHAEELRVGKWQRGKMVQPGVPRGMHLRFFNYEGTGEKDLGGMTDDQIVRGLYEAQHSTVVRLGTEKQERERRGLHGGAQAVSGAARRANGRPRALPADGRRRNGQDTDDRRGRRGAARRVR